MSANAQIVTLFAVLVLTAAVVRVVAGPIPKPAGGRSLYAMGKFGPGPERLTDPVEYAVSDAPSAR